MMSRDYCNIAELSIPGVPAPARSPDALLSSFLRTADKAESDVLLETLICEHAQPLIKEIIRGSLHGSFPRSTNGGLFDDAEDIASGVVLKLLKRLDDLKAHPHDKGIPSFRDYVAVAAYNACHEYLRQKYPERSRLKNKVRYILTRQEGLALWEVKNKAWLCGLAVWRDEKRVGVPSSRLRYLCGDVRAPTSFAGSQLALSRNIVELVTAIFQLSGGPLALDDLVSLVAELWGVKDFPPRTDDGSTGPGDGLERLASADVDPATKVEQRMQLARLWEEIRAQLSY